jgi:hypothetical protein
VVRLLAQCLPGWRGRGRRRGGRVPLSATRRGHCVRTGRSIGERGYESGRIPKSRRARQQNPPKARRPAGKGLPVASRNAPSPRRWQGRKPATVSTKTALKRGGAPMEASNIGSTLFGPDSLAWLKGNSCRNEVQASSVAAWLQPSRNPRRSTAHRCSRGAVGSWLWRYSAGTY